MNEKELYHRLKDESLFNKAFVYAIQDRSNKDDFCNFFELNFYEHQKIKLQEEIRNIIDHPEDFRHSVCFAYYVPKNNLCLRRHIYIPFQELVLRYMILIIIVENTEYTLSKQCFSYRKAAPENQNKNLFEPYQILFDSYVNWQEKTWKTNNFKVLLDTDISSFYDSISHDYLIKLLIKKLDISQDSQFILLFRKLLNFRVISYSFIEHSLFETEFRQGLVIGNNIDGYLANIYLLDIDEALEKVKVEFGRYVDDTKIFTASKEDALHYSRIIQEFLLKKGLNFNATKTKIWEDEQEIKDKIENSRIEREDYFGTSDDSDNFYAKEQLEKEDKETIPLDKKMNDQTIFPETYSPDQEIKNLDDAKLWAKYVNTQLKPQNSLDNDELVIRQINQIKIVIKSYPSANPTKTCAWLIVKFCFWHYPNSIQKTAYNEMLDILQDDQINSWTKARILHNLIKPTRGSLSYIKRLNTIPDQMEKFKPILNKLIAYPSVELQINSLYAIYEILEDKKDIIEVIKKFMPKPIPLPIQDIVSQLQILNFTDIRLATIDEIRPDPQDNQEDNLEFHS